MFNQSSRRLILLGPQPEYETLKQALTRVEVSSMTGVCAVITAGWEEDELTPDRKDPLMAILPSDSVNLQLFQRSEQLFAEDPELIGFLRKRQDKLRHLRNVYCTRLDDVLDAARKTLRREDPLIDLSPECESAIEMVRQLDRQYFVRTSQICDTCEQQLDVANRLTVTRHQNEIAEMLADVSAIIISGGHTAIILNRLRIFGILDMVPKTPVIAWSGGAMALADQVVLFHDCPPQGRGNAEVLRAGMSIYGDFLPLPDARNRLLLDDRYRVELFARRFHDFQCVLFDEQTIMDRENGVWWTGESTLKMGQHGRLVDVTIEVAT